MVSRATESKYVSPAPLLVLGLSRTGGTSLSHALAILGYENLYDLDDIANGGPEHANFWQQAVQRKLAGQDGFSKDEADDLLRTYDGVRNVPAAAFAAELIRYYPSSKVILPIRDVDAWHASYLTTVYQRSVDPVLGILGLFHSGSRIYGRLLQGLQQVLYCGDFKNYGKKAFVEHSEYIRTNTSPGLLLEYQVQQGWEPLCKFLGKEVPACEFPRSNDRDSFWKGCRSRDARIAKAFATKALLVVVVGGTVWWFKDAFLKLVPR